jgi:myo-inositol catabolism protein IolC
MLTDWSKKDLLILAFDHRASFIEKLFGIKGRPPTADEKKKIEEAKEIIFDGFKAAVSKKVPKDIAGLLVDEEFGAKILREAKKEGFNFAMPAEKSGQDEFDFEYGDQFSKHIEDFDPTFLKVLVRYNPESDAVLTNANLNA